MGSKILLLLGLSVAFVILASTSQVVAARVLAEATSDNGGGYYNGGDGTDPYYEIGGTQYRLNRSRSYHGGGGHYNGGGSHHGGGGSCHHYCHGRCCSAAEAQALEAAQVKPQN